MNFFSFGLKTLAVDIFDIGQVFYCLFSLIPKVMYILSNCFLTVLDIFQLLFRKLAGLDGYYVNGNYQEGDIVYQFIKGTVMGEYPVLTNVFWGLIIFAVILLFLSTIISIIRNEYTAEKDGNSKSKIIGKSFKSIFFFAIVPIVVLFGVYLANVVLVAVDKVTSPATADSTILKTNLLEKYTRVNDEEGEEDSTTQSYIAYNFFGIPVGTTTTTFSGVVFKASAYNANRVRTTLNTTIEENATTYNGFFGLVQANVANNWNGLFRDENGNADVVAEYIDEAFANFVKLKISGSSDEYLLKYDSAYIQNYNVNDFNPFATFQTQVVDSINRYNVELVWYYYDLWQYNFLVAFGAGIVMIVIFINIIIGLMKRIIELLGLFLISAPLVALMPLDDGKSYNKWRENFIKKTLMAYGAVAGMNIFFLIFPYLNEIQFFNILVIDRIISTIIIIVGLVSVKGFIGLISDMIGAENAEDVGGKIAKDVGGTIAKAGLMTAAAVATGGAGLLAAGKIGAKGLAVGAKGLKKGVGAGIRQAAPNFVANRTNKKAVNMFKKEHFNDEDIEEKVETDLRTNNADYNTMSDEEFEKQKYSSKYRKDFAQEKNQVLDDLSILGVDKVSGADVKPHPLRATKDAFNKQVFDSITQKYGAKAKIGGALGMTGRGLTKVASPLTYSVTTAAPPITKSLGNLFGMGYDAFKGNGITQGFSDAGGFGKLLNTIVDITGSKEKNKKQEKSIKEMYDKIKSEEAAREKFKKELEAKEKGKGKQ